MEQVEEVGVIFEQLKVHVLTIAMHYPYSTDRRIYAVKLL